VLRTRVRAEELNQRVAKRIRTIARERRIPVTHLPDRAAVGRSHFWEVMAGRSSPTLEWLARVAAALDVDPGELVVAVRAPSARPARAARVR
jgi:transcriptional regulator with XRE-family HTH domain